MKPIFITLLLLPLIATAETVVDQYAPSDKWKGVTSVVDKFESDGNVCYVVTAISKKNETASVSISCVKKELAKITVDK